MLNVKKSPSTTYSIFAVNKIELFAAFKNTMNSIGIWTFKLFSILTYLSDDDNRASVFFPRHTSICYSCFLVSYLSCNLFFVYFIRSSFFVLLLFCNLKLWWFFLVCISLLSFDIRLWNQGSTIQYYIGLNCNTFRLILCFTRD